MYCFDIAIIVCYFFSSCMYLWHCGLGIHHNKKRRFQMDTICNKYKTIQCTSGNLYNIVRAFYSVLLLIV